MSSKEKGKWKEYYRIHENYNYMNQMMIREIELASVHGGLTGNYREGMWVKFFRGIIPLKYSLAQGVILIDSEGNVSKEVDIAIYDEQFTPYVFQYNSLKFIPIEAVVIAIECKSTSFSKDALIDWCNSIKELKPRPTGIARVLAGPSIGLTNQTQTRTRPLRILTTMKPVGKNNDPQIQEQELTENNDPRSLENVFDFIISEEVCSDSRPEKKEFRVHVKNKCNSLQWWSRELNQCDLEVKEGGNEHLKLQRFDASVIKDHLEINKLQTALKKVEGKEKESLTNIINMLAKTYFEDQYPELRLNSKLELENTLEDLEVPNNPLLTLNFQINQLLMLLNNPMLFPHFAYANAFKKACTEYGEEEKRKEKTK